MNLIKYEENDTNLVHKINVEDLNPETELIVYEGQEALFYSNGEISNIYKAGRYNLYKDDTSFFKRLFNKNNKSKLCNIYFINKKITLDILWGTDSPIIVEDPRYGILVNIRANGQTGIKIIDSKKFIINVVGRLDDYSSISLKRNIKSHLMSTIKSTLSKAINQDGNSILDINNNLLDLSLKINNTINPLINDLGIELIHFMISSITAPDDDLKKLKEIKQKKLELMNDYEIEAYKTVKLAQAKSEARALEGYSYQEERCFDIEASKAKNNSFENNKSSNEINNNLVSCTSCNELIPNNSKFCPLCGSKQIEKPKFKFCPNCGNKLTNVSLFCSECGFKLK